MNKIIDMVPIKEFVMRTFRPGCCFREVILACRHKISAEEALAKLDDWFALMNLIRSEDVIPGAKSIK